MLLLKYGKTAVSRRKSSLFIVDRWEKLVLLWLLLSILLFMTARWGAAWATRITRVLSAEQTQQRLTLARTTFLSQQSKHHQQQKQWRWQKQQQKHQKEQQQQQP